ncbi:DivIVA domain-containing protein [Eggerthellaceae bacterium zg-1084]|uniref:Cell wall synthesis protein Wag31 n=1 Tax=Berryella wangjianweii TaxID=2734634 RepID=A0A6M8JAT9_9ACTN|nr:DivIVA domain-containing protein [Berryella wangjianweii]NPD31437.1 DivIVA domain-containing protein [Berryella wangjianweii]NPD33063.1 DivIVA domain-containing protein [Eggerthellaceae bacterium zg-997]QKF07932.1 DivIVA domain-containing protein [Berryella wangjianweii]
MAITSEDIQKQRFSIDRKGYNVDEVDVFLTCVADELDALHGQISSLKAQLEEARSQVADPGVTQAVAPVAPAAPVPPVVAPVAAPAPEPVSEDAAALQQRLADLESKLAEKVANDTAISQALIVAQRSADDIVSNARSQATTIVNEADAEAERIVHRAEAERDKVIEATRVLEDAREEVRVEYRTMLADFITDASRKLNEVDEHAPNRAAARATLDQVAPAPQAIDGATAGFAPAPAAAAAGAYAPAQPAPYFEKDLSGFGDADQAFDFDDPD